MTKFNASIIIPICNQYASLCYVLNGFKAQSVDMNSYELVIIDDGSVDQLSEISSRDLHLQYNLNINLLHQNNMGRAHARNTGAMNAHAEYLIFCDGDRIPHVSFIEEHLKYSQSKCVLIGDAYDYYGPVSVFEKETILYSEVKKMSRIPYYYKKIERLYSSSYKQYSWLSFLVGNSSISKDLLIQCGGFDEKFVEWGFEHFELGYRLYKQGIEFRRNPNAMSFHLPHSRENGFYIQHIMSSIDYICKKHPDISKDFLEKFFNVKGELK